MESLNCSWCLALISGILVQGVLAAPPRSALAADQAVAMPENLALGKTYKFSPAPNYSYCTDPDDAVQLTDGKTTKDYFWTQKGTVGWVSAPYVAITVDLGREEPISGVTFDTAAGVAAVEWPAEIDVLTSSDGKTYRHAGELVTLDQKTAGPWPKGYAIRRLSTRELKARGRYVQFLVIPRIGSPFTFCDEVEVFRGPSELVADAPGPTIPDVTAFFQSRRRALAVGRRYAADVASLAAVIRGAHHKETAETRLLSRLDVLGGELQKEAARMGSPSPAAEPFRAILPFSPAHAQVFALQAQSWRESGASTLSGWVPRTWDPVPLFLSPPPGPGGRIDVHLVRGEHRAAAVDLANSGQEPLDLVLELKGTEPNSAVLTTAAEIQEVPWTDTAPGEPVAAALRPMVPAATGLTTRVEPGLIRQLWLTFHVDRQTPPGEYRGELVLKPLNQGPQATTIRVPVSLHVYGIDFPETTTLGVGGWSYTDGKGHQGLTAANRADFIRHLRQRLVNCPWATAGVLMSCQFAAGDPDKVELDTRSMDEWLAQWPAAKRYMVFLSVGESLGGSRYDSPEFARRVKAWISAWVAHLKAKGVAEGQLGLLVVDEPHEGTDVRPLVAWARAIHAASPHVLIWEDPTYQDPAKSPAELLEVCQVLCPNRPMWLAGGEKFGQFYLDQKRQGRALEFYSCSGPAKLLDPYSYYRLQAWHCWQIGAEASSFWSFSDNDGSSSWNEYLAKAGPYTPLFLDDTSVTAGKQMEAIRESAEDYECLAMLRRAIEAAKASGKAGPAITQAESLLTGGVRQVLAAPDADKLFWRDPKDRSRADAVRIEVLKALSALR